MCSHVCATAMYLESRVQPVAVVSFFLLSGDITNLIFGLDLSLFFFLPENI